MAITEVRPTKPVLSARPAGHPSPPAIGPLGRLARAAFRHQIRTIVLWCLAFGLALAASSAWGGAFRADYSAPGSDSRAAYDLLKKALPASAAAHVTVVARSDRPINSSSARVEVRALMREISAVPAVTKVTDPFSSPAAVSPDRHTVVATVSLDVDDPVDLPKTSAQALLRLAAQSSHDRLTVALGGDAIANAEAPPIGSEGIGLAFATLILLLMFGSVVAAGLPLLVALAGLAVSAMLTGLVTALLPVPDWSTSLATMMGIGVGIDYALLMVTRYREWRAAGLSSEDATVATLDTAGRSVLLAGGTVVVSMLGLFAMGLSFMRGAALVSIVAILVVLTAAITLFPALLGIFGTRIDKLRIPLPSRRNRPIKDERAEGWLRWSRFVQRHRLGAALAGTGILLTMATPFLGVQFGFPDAGNNAKDTSTRAAYDMLAEAYGPGTNGPLILAAELPPKAGGVAPTTGISRAAAALRSTPGVASVSPIQLAPSGNTAVITVTPTTGPQNRATEDLVRHLRDTVLPEATAGTNTTIHVGGATAVSIDSTANIAKRIPLLIGGVVLLSMFLLLVSFRSIAVAVKAAVMNLLSVGASYGVVALVLQGGSAGHLVGINNPTPLAPFVPVLMFAVLFGLSMDYEVFLVSSMREAWLRTGENTDAIVSGLAGTARVITAAASIMIAVFAAFIPSPDVALKVIGVGMATAIFIDATVIRMMLVPAVMHLLGAKNWWLPAWLDRLPELHVEGHPEHYRHLAAQGSHVSGTPNSAAAAKTRVDNSTASASRGTPSRSQVV